MMLLLYFLCTAKEKNNNLMQAIRSIVQGYSIYL
jgi:hypothetical protein